MNRSLKLPLLIALALGSTQVLAVDIGQIQVKSALGQPLLAEIPVHAATPAELQNLTAQLASSDEFARAGIAGGRTAIPLRVSVADAAGGQRVIRITSAAPVEDPFLDLLIEVNAQSGKSVREFAILLDPPGGAAAVTGAAAPMRQTQPAPARQAAASATTPARAQTATGAVERAPVRAAPAATSTESVAGKYGPVVRGDTLSSIARNATPAGVQMQQMLLAIKQANPDAFYRDNINALKTGAILRMPTATEAQSMAVAAAIAEVRRQNGDWTAKTAVSPATVADTATRASASSAPTTAASGTGDRLALVPATDGAAAGANGADGGSSSKGKGNASSTAVQKDLLRTRESLASVQQQSTDLKGQVKDLTDINAKNTRLLALKDSEIADLQASLAAARKGGAALPAAAGSAPAAAASSSAAVAATASAAPAPVVASTATAPAGGATVGEVAAAAVASTAPALAPVPVAAASAPVAAVVTPDTAPAASASVASGAASVAPWYMQTWAWAAGAGAVVLLLLLMLLGRRRKPLADTTGASSSLADRFVAAPAGSAPLTGDVEQDELLDQLAERPDDVGLHLELVTLYYSRRDVERFEAAAEAMHAHIADPEQDEWQDVLHMGEDLAPGHPLFDHHVEPVARIGEDPLKGFDIDDYADSTADLPGSASPASAANVNLADPPRKVGGYAYDFDLTAHPALPPALPPAASARADAVAQPPANASASSSAAAAAADDAAASTWQFEQADAEPAAIAAADDLGEFNDDPIDTKLDLARAYLDMGDAEGARAMLGEVIKEGSQPQQDVARELLRGLPH